MGPLWLHAPLFAGSQSRSGCPAPRFVPGLSARASRPSARTAWIPSSAREFFCGRDFAQFYIDFRSDAQYLWKVYAVSRGRPTPTAPRPASDRRRSVPRPRAPASACRTPTRSRMHRPIRPRASRAQVLGFVEASLLFQIVEQQQSRVRRRSGYPAIQAIV